MQEMEENEKNKTLNTLKTNRPLDLEKQIEA